MALKYNGVPVENGGSVDTTEGDPCTTFSCKAEGARPESTFTWTIDSNTEVPSDEETITTNPGDPKLHDTLSTMECPIFGAKTQKLCCSASTPFEEDPIICITVTAAGMYHRLICIVTKDQRYFCDHFNYRHTYK